MPTIGGIGIDGEVSKQFQKILTKQGLAFKLGTKVVSASKSGEQIMVEVENVKDPSKKETVSNYINSYVFTLLMIFFSIFSWIVMFYLYVLAVDLIHKI